MSLPIGPTLGYKGNFSYKPLPKITTSLLYKMPIISMILNALEEKHADKKQRKRVGSIWEKTITKNVQTSKWGGIWRKKQRRTVYFIAGKDEDGATDTLWGVSSCVNTQQNKSRKTKHDIVR